MIQPFLIIGFIVALALAVGLWNQFYGLLLIADDPNPTSSYPKAPITASGPRALSPLTDCPRCGLYAYHLFTPHASVSQCGYDVKMMGRECVAPGCVGEWAEEWDRVLWSRPTILVALHEAEWTVDAYRELQVEPGLLTAAYVRRDQLAIALELTRA
jgi:hypothetical protein